MELIQPAIDATRFECGHRGDGVLQLGRLGLAAFAQRPCRKGGGDGPHIDRRTADRQGICRAEGIAEQIVETRVPFGGKTNPILMIVDGPDRGERLAVLEAVEESGCGTVDLGHPKGKRVHHEVHEEDPGAIRGFALPTHHQEAH